MNYIQIKQPNLNISEKAGLCLQYTENSFGVPNLYDNAWQAWRATQYKHLDRNFPENVSVPVWFDWSSNVLWDDGIVRYGRYGHVAYRTPDGKIHSSPGQGFGSKTFNDVDELIWYFVGGMTYVGWSEDIADVKVIEGEDMSRIQDLEDMANYRQSLLDSIGATVSVKAPVDGNNVAQVIANIKTQQNRIDELGGIVSGLQIQLKDLPMDTSDAEKRLQSIKDALGIL